MQNKTGFTLLEVLIVVVIAVSVLMFAAPAYRRAQDRSMYLAAQGVLVEVASAVQALRADLAAQPTVEVSAGGQSQLKVFPGGGTPVQLTVAMQTDLGEEGNDPWANSLNRELNAMTYEERLRALFSRGYLQPLPFDNGNTYKGYEFFICPQVVVTQGCCNQSGTVACMLDNDAGATRVAQNTYRGARISESGLISRIDDED